MCVVEQPGVSIPSILPFLGRYCFGFKITWNLTVQSSQRLTKKKSTPANYDNNSFTEEFRHGLRFKDNDHVVTTSEVPS